jgi:hypothetical protein
MTLGRIELVSVKSRARTSAELSNASLIVAPIGSDRRHKQDALS